MAKNREHEKPLKSESESGEEEHDEQSSEEESDSEPEPTQVSKKPSSTLPTVKKTQLQSSSKPHQPPSSSSDEEESGSESESDADGPDHNAKLIPSKPMEDPQKSINTARKTRSKSNTSDLVTPAKPTPAKLPADEKETEVKDAKKSKKKKAEPEPEQENTAKKSGDDPKKAYFQRVWSEDDEIVLLKGVIDYTAKKKSDLVADLNAFHDFIKKSLHVDVNRSQLQDKIRRLKRKYMNNNSKEKEGKIRTFPKPHEQKAYELSKKIWGSENGGEEVIGSPRSNGSIALRNRGSKRVAENDEAKDVKSVEGLLLPPPAKKLCHTGLSVEQRVLKIGEDICEGDKEWNMLCMEQMEVHMRDLEVKAAQVKLVLNFLKSGGADNS